MTTRANLYVDQGVDYSVNLEMFTSAGADFPADDYNFYASARKLYSTTKAFDFEATVIRDDDDINTFELNISADKTVNLEPGKYQYDVLMSTIGGGTTEKIVEGIIFLIPTITKVV